MNEPSSGPKRQIADSRCDARAQLNEAVQNSLSRVRSWPKPHNWAPNEWLREIRQVALLAASKAVVDYAAFRHIPLGAFAYQRIIATLRTYYRQEYRQSSRYLAITALKDARTNGQSALEQIPSSSRTPEELSKLRETRVALRILRKSDRHLLIKVYWLRKTESQLAREMGLTQQAVSKRLHSSLHQLRGYLQA